jgi:hypothetical protein
MSWLPSVVLSLFTFDLSPFTFDLAHPSFHACLPAFSPFLTLSMPSTHASPPHLSTSLPHLLQEFGEIINVSAYYQVPSYSMARLAFYGSNGFMMFNDVDEMMVLPGKRPLPYELTKGCLKDAGSQVVFPDIDVMSKVAGGAGEAPKWKDFEQPIKELNKLDYWRNKADPHSLYRFHKVALHSRNMYTMSAHEVYGSDWNGTMVDPNCAHLLHFVNLSSKRYKDVDWSIYSPIDLSNFSYPWTKPLVPISNKKLRLH